MKSESKIICKYFILGKCKKGEKCPYLHSQFNLEQDQDDFSERECPMYSIGYCKNGPMCKFIHIKKDKNGNKINENKIEENNNNSNDNDNNYNDTSSTPLDGDSITISYQEEKEKKELESDKEDKEEESLNNNKIIPIWYLEHYYGKPISTIFSELENENLPEVIALQKKYGFSKKDNQINMNLNFNNFDMNFAFNNYYSFNFPVNNIMNEGYPFYLNNNYNDYYCFYNSNPYLSKIDYIEYLINNFYIVYHLVKLKNYKYVKNCQISNEIEIPYHLYKKYEYQDNNIIIIIIIYNIEDEEFSGFAKLEYAINQKENNNYKNKFRIKWLWKNGINYSEVSHLVNKSDKNHFLCEGKNWCPIHSDLGNYMCRLMLKRLNKEEVFELINEKNIFHEQMLFNRYKNKKKFKEESFDEEENNYDSESNFRYKIIYDEDNINDEDNQRKFIIGKKRKRKYKDY